MIGGSLVGHGHPPGSSRRSVPAKTAGAILAGMRPNIALTPPLNRCPLLAQSGHHDPLNQCPHLGVKRTYKSGRGRRLGGGKLQRQRSVRSVRFSLTRAVKGHMNSPWTVRTTPAVSVHVRVAFRRGRGICGCIELICYQIMKAPAGSGGGLVLSGLRPLRHNEGGQHARTAHRDPCVRHRRRIRGPDGDQQTSARRVRRRARLLADRSGGKEISRFHPGLGSHVWAIVPQQSSARSSRRPSNF